MYKEIYRIGNKITKRDKLGLHAKVESVILEILSLAIAAAFTPREKKKSILESARLKTEIAKQLIRTEQELHIIAEASYLALEEGLQEISKMLNGWINSLP
ncbi:MAG: four helix bundle protein [Candidatus Taylorbacteria bacterium]|nr:four helix bundle protein [Candidatus Taylorbacteria bacterium]